MIQHIVAPFLQDQSKRKIFNIYEAYRIRPGSLAMKHGRHSLRWPLELLWKFLFLMRNLAADDRNEAKNKLFDLGGKHDLKLGGLNN